MRDVKKQLASRIKELREAAQLTQAELASLSSKSLETISNFERGKTTPSILTLARLSQVLGVSMKDFFDGKPPKKDRKPLLTAIQNKSEALKKQDQEFLLGVIDLLHKCPRKP